MTSNKWRRSAGWLALATVIGVAGCASNGKPAETAGAYVDDSLITAKVKTAFLSDKTVDALDIGVTTTNGVVQLTGVGTPDEARKASELARGVAGVKSVQNNIRAK